MAKLKVRTYGDPCLRKKSSLVKGVGTSERMLIAAMLEAMHEHKGVGLAAPQVGINQQIFVADTGDGPVVVVNPKVLKKIGSETTEEGCLSIPGVAVKVRRAKKIWVRYTDQNNQTVERDFADLMARVFLHETDHLLGRLIIDYASLTQKAKLRKQLKAIKEQQQSV